MIENCFIIDISEEEYMAIMEIINSLFMIFIMIIPGIIFQKKGLIDANQSKGISKIGRAHV